MPDPMASEPAEPTTRQDPEWLAGMIAAFLSGARGMTQLKPWPEVAERLVAWLEDRGLLADPAQTTELERLRDAIPKLRDAYQVKLGEFAAETLRTSRALRACTVTPTHEHVPQHIVGEALLGWIGAQEHIHGEITRDLDPEDVDARADLLTELGLLRAERHVLTAERDRLSLLLRGMARKLVAYRKWTLGETPTIHRLIDALRGEAETADDVTVSAIRLMNRAGQERDVALWLHAETKWWLDQYMHDVTLWKRQVDELTVERDGWKTEQHETAAERDERQARIDAALALLDPKVIGKGDAFTREEDIHHFAVVRAALVGDQPPAEDLMANEAIELTAALRANDGHQEES